MTELCQYMESEQSLEGFCSEPTVFFFRFLLAADPRSKHSRKVSAKSDENWLKYIEDEWIWVKVLLTNMETVNQKITGFNQKKNN